jgi:hypothetical protein
LVDAETRLNPAAGSIYFGNSVGSNATSSTKSDVRPSTPEDPQAKIRDSLSKLSDEDRSLVEAQRFCPILTSNQLGSMGPPVKVMVDGHPVFLCCSGCKQKALDNPVETLATVQALKDKSAARVIPMGSDAKAGPMERSQMKSVPSQDELAEIKANLSNLTPADRTLAESQKVCPITGARLGSMGAPIKITVEGQSVFLCCDGCKDQALKDPKATLAKVAELKQSNSPQPRGEQAK